VRTAFPMILLFAASASSVPLEHLNLEKEDALSGCDAVSCHQGSPKMSQDQWSHHYGGTDIDFLVKRIWRHLNIGTRNCRKPPNRV